MKVNVKIAIFSGLFLVYLQSSYADPNDQFSNSINTLNKINQQNQSYNYQNSVNQSLKNQGYDNSSNIQLHSSTNPVTEVRDHNNQPTGTYEIKGDQNFRNNQPANSREDAEKLRSTTYDPNHSGCYGYGCGNR